MTIDRVVNDPNKEREEEQHSQNPMKTRGTTSNGMERARERERQKDTDIDGESGGQEKRR